MVLVDDRRVSPTHPLRPLPATRAEAAQLNHGRHRQFPDPPLLQDEENADPPRFELLAEAKSMSRREYP